MTNEETAKMIERHRKWVLGALNEISVVLKLKRDYAWYMQDHARLTKKVEYLERRIEALEG